MNNKSYSYFINKAAIAVLIFICIFSACKSSKKEETATIALEKVSKEERFKRIIRSEISYNTIASNLRFSIKNEKRDMAVDAQLKISKSEAIQLSFRIPIFGSEAFKITITPEKLIVVDRINKQYMEEYMWNIKNKIPVDFDYYSLEALLSNRLFLSGKEEVTLRDMKTFSIIENDYWVKISNTDKQKIQYDFISNYTDRIQQVQIAQYEWQYQLNCEYADWGVTSQKSDFPMTMKFSMKTPDKSAQVNMSFKSVVINSDFNIDYTTPNKYKKVSFQQVLNLIKKLL